MSGPFGIFFPKYVCDSIEYVHVSFIDHATSLPLFHYESAVYLVFYVTFLVNMNNSSFFL